MGERKSERDGHSVRQCGAVSLQRGSQSGRGVLGTCLNWLIATVTAWQDKAKTHRNNRVTHTHTQHENICSRFKIYLTKRT